MRRGNLLAAAGVCLAAVISAAGCGLTARARLWADTALPDGGFSLQQRQWAYDGETVTFELEADPGVTNYVVFGVSGEETVVSTPHSEGHYRWSRAFRCGDKPQTYEVYAVPYLLRGRCDYIYDANEDKWYYYPGAQERPDVPSDREKTVRITCYRVEVRLRFVARGGPPRSAALTLTRADGRSAVIRQRSGPADGEPGFLLQGPDGKGMCEVSYVPRHDEVSRAGVTGAELVIDHADGTTERLRQELKTP